MVITSLTPYTATRVESVGRLRKRSFRSAGILPAYRCASEHAHLWISHPTGKRWPAGCWRYDGSRAAKARRFTWPL